MLGVGRFDRRIGLLASSRHDVGLCWLPSPSTRLGLYRLRYPILSSHEATDWGGSKALSIQL